MEKSNKNNQPNNVKFDLLKQGKYSKKEGKGKNGILETMSAISFSWKSGQYPQSKQEYP